VVTRLATENARARAIGRGRRSQIYLWLRARHDQLVESFAETGPAWSSIAAHLGNIGLVGGWGKPPAPETVRKAWYLVRRDVAARAGSAPGVVFARPTTSAPVLPAPVIPLAGDPVSPERGVRTVGLKSAPAALAVRENGLPSDADIPEGEPSPEPEFKFATFPSWSPSAPRSDASATSAVSQRQDPDEVIARLLARPRRGSIPMPDIPEPEDE